MAVSSVDDIWASVLARVAVHMGRRSLLEIGAWEGTKGDYMLKRRVANARTVKALRD